jgi:hypothetical protein
MKKRKFEVIFSYSQLSRAKVMITAKSLEEAQEKAEEMNADEIPADNFNPIDGTLDVDNIQEVK